MSDNVEIISSNTPNLSHNVEDNTNNEVEKIFLSIVNDKKGKKEEVKSNQKNKKVSKAWEHFYKNNC